jgi:hypothetical protein
LCDDTGGCDERAYHAMTVELRVGVKNAVGGRVVTSSVHGIGPGLVQRCGKAHIAGDKPGDGDLRHCEGVRERFGRTLAPDG